jgi:hypothetical protein
MIASKLGAWLIGKAKDAFSIELTYAGSQGVEEVASWPFDSTDDFCAEVVTAANDDATEREARSDYMLRVVAEDRRVIASKRIRGYPPAGTKEVSSAQPEIQLQKLFTHIEKCHTLLTKQQDSVHAFYADLLQEQRKVAGDKDTEIRALHTLLRKQASEEGEGEAGNEADDMEQVANIVTTGIKILEGFADGEPAAATDPSATVADIGSAKKRKARK